jgi:Zn-dependent protease
MLIRILFENPVLFLIIAMAIIFALAIHEFFHAWMAYYLGDNTAKDQGRLTINPLVHLDLFGTILLFIVGIGWGKPVPFNPYNLRNQKWGPALVALAGPASNFGMAVTFGLILRFAEIPNPYFVFFLSFFVWINLILGVFNLMPVPPLDGSHIFFTLFPSLENVKASIQGSFLFLIAIIFFMIYIGIPFIIKPLFVLITGGPLMF